MARVRIGGCSGPFQIRLARAALTEQRIASSIEGESSFEIYVEQRDEARGRAALRTVLDGDPWLGKMLEARGIGEPAPPPVPPDPPIAARPRRRRNQPGARTDRTPRWAIVALLAVCALIAYGALSDRPILQAIAFLACLAGIIAEGRTSRVTAP